MTGTIDEFLKTGCLGGIAAGASRDELRRLLGDPDDVSVRENPEIWKYGSLELTLFAANRDDEPRLATIALNFNSPEPSFPDAIRLTGWRPGPDTGTPELLKHLQEIGVDTPAQCSPSRHGTLVLPGAGVVASFAEGRLHGLSYTAKRGRAPEVKQLSVSIPSEALEIIRKEAAGRRISVSALCSEWIREHVSQLQKIGTS